MAESAAPPPSELAEHYSNCNRIESPTVASEANAAITGGTLRHSEGPQVAPQCSVLDSKKTSSFQITSVRASSSVSNDGEDDSCGEVEDSSEIGSSHSQILLKPFDLPEAAIGVAVSIAQQVTDVGNFKPDHGWQGRFRVVKIESSEPFKRGRWLCMDFLDQPSVQPTLSKDEPGSGASSSGSLSDHASADEANQNSTPIQQPAAVPSNQVLMMGKLGYQFQRCQLFFFLGSEPIKPAGRQQCSRGPTFLTCQCGLYELHADHSPATAAAFVPAAFDS